MENKKVSVIEEDYLCNVDSIDEEKVKKVLTSMKSESVMVKMAETFKALADKTRCKLIYALSSVEEFCVCDLAEILGVSKFVVSQHLRVLRNMRLVKYRKVGKRVFYSLDDEHITNLISEALRHVEEEKQ